MKLLATWDAARQAWVLSTSLYKGKGLLKRIKQNLRWAAAAAARPEDALTWFSMMRSEDLAPFAKANPLLSFKPMRVYLSTRWAQERRTEVMRHGAAREALLRPEEDGVVLARMELGDLGPGELRLGFDHRFRKEGEFAVTLWCPQRGGRICTFSFALEWQERGLVMYAGAVQGTNREEETIMKTLGKLMHGLRPKALVGFAGQEIARTLGVREILAAGNTIQVHRKKHLIHLGWAHDVTFDYDAFWSELGGRPAFDGWFHLPRKAKRRSREEIKPNKRTLYARRYALMDDLAAQIRTALKPDDPAGPAPDPEGDSASSPSA